MIRVIIEREVAEGLEEFYETAIAKLLGAMSKHMPLRPESWKIALGKRLPSRILALNLCAFEEGLELSRVPTV